MRRSTANRHLQRLREKVAELSKDIDSFDESVQEPWFRSMKLHPNDKEPTEIGPQFSISYGSRGRILAIDEEEMTPEQLMRMAVGSFWVLFEGHRDAGDPGDKETFDKFMKEFTERAKKRCWQK